MSILKHSRLRFLILPGGSPRLRFNGAGESGSSGGTGDGTSNSAVSETGSEAAAAAGPEAGGDAGAGSTGAQGDEPDDSEGADQLGDPGKRALDAMKAQRNQHRDAARAEKARADAAERERAALQAKLEGREDEHAAEQQRQQSEAAALAKANDRIRKAELRAAAAGKLANPADALAFIDLEQIAVDDDGAVDQDAIADQIDQLLTERPYLAAGGAQRFQGGADGGADKGATKPRQLTETDVKNMSPAEVNQAMQNGQLVNLMSGKK